MAAITPDIHRFDVAIIGGGVVGCATARRLALSGASVVLIEKSADILAGASKANSALLHTGFDAPIDSLELTLMQRGYHEYLAIREDLNLPLLETGAMVVAWTKEEEEKLASIKGQAHANGVESVRQMSRAEALAREPGLSPNVHGALLVPGEHVIDPWSAPLAYLVHAIAHGATVWRGAELIAGRFEGACWRLETRLGALIADRVINCAGLYGDHVEQMCLGNSSFEIRPRKGQFVVFDKPAARLMRTIILPVPTERTKGVVLCRTIWGNLLVGPTAEEQPERDRSTVDEATLKTLIARAKTMLPGLADIPITAIYAGLRPATEEKHYRIRYEPTLNWLSLGGIRSTGLTAALGLAAYAAEHFGFEDAAPTRAASVPNLADHEKRDWQRPGYDKIVCHCEMVTRREIMSAFDTPLPPVDVAGVKRRTRATMGRCQGFYCNAEVRQILAERKP